MIYVNICLSKSEMSNKFKSAERNGLKYSWGGLFE